MGNPAEHRRRLGSLHRRDLDAVGGGPVGGRGLSLLGLGAMTVVPAALFLALAAGSALAARGNDPAGFARPEQSTMKSDAKTPIKSGYEEVTIIGHPKGGKREEVFIGGPEGSIGHVTATRGPDGGIGHVTVTGG
jgi:hypothetical protein